MICHYLYWSRIYNYSKMSARGVKDICVELDGRVIYMGALKSSER